MYYEFPVSYSVIGSRGDGGDSLVCVELTDEEADRLRIAAKNSGILESLSDAKEIADINEKVEAAFREDQLGFMDNEFLETAAEYLGEEIDELDDEKKWDAFNGMISYSIYYPEEFMDEDDGEDAEEEDEQN